eukprot:m.509275 g.509275  ORF g.509275 m.509275 type:complete len:55 (-) comp57399_c0_seq1:1837-2001(-)
MSQAASWSLERDLSWKRMLAAQPVDVDVGHRFCVTADVRSPHAAGKSTTPASHP